MLFYIVKSGASSIAMSNSKGIWNETKYIYLYIALSEISFFFVYPANVWLFDYRKFILQACEN